MVKYIEEIKSCKIYLEPYSYKMRDAIELNKSMFKGDIKCSIFNKYAYEFWTTLHKDKIGLVKEIRVIFENIEQFFTEAEISKYINNKLLDTRILKRAAIFYYTLYGVQEENEIENTLEALRVDSFGIDLSYNNHIELMRDNESWDTFINIKPSVQINLLSDELMNYLKNSKSRFAIQTFNTPELISAYKDFNITFSYVKPRRGENRLTLQITNF